MSVSLRELILMGVLLLILGISGLLYPEPFWWFGGACVITVMGWAGLIVGKSQRERAVAWLTRPRKLWRFEYKLSTLAIELLCVGALLVVSAIMLRSVMTGDRPVSHDHTVHFFKAWQTKEMLFESGTLRGWSHQWFGGYPANYLYPVGADLWVIAVYIMGLGLLTFGQAYGVGFGVFWFFQGYAIYRFGHRAFSRGVGVLAAILYMTDTGGFRYGGFNFAVEWGVWPQSLSVAIAVLAFARVPQMISEAQKGGGAGAVSWRHVGVFGALLGAALITHPTVLLFSLIALLVGFVAVVLSDTRRHTGMLLIRLGAGTGLGIMVSAMWLLSFVTSSSHADKFGQWWHDFHTMGSRSSS